MIVVIQCAAKKREQAGRFRAIEGRDVLFVGDPLRAPHSDPLRYARPDDLSEDGRTWRDVLLDYNRRPNENPLRLCRAIDLYLNPAYLRLASWAGVAKTYVLSAGWGLIRADFLTPEYDITLSASAEPYKRRRRTDVYSDMRMLPEDNKEPVIFFGGKDYVLLFCTLTERIAAQKTVFYNSGTPPHAPGCTLSRFKTATRTNWHYECANAIVNGHVSVTS